jgi:peroxiredoxin family protein
VVYKKVYNSVIITFIPAIEKAGKFMSKKKKLALIVHSGTMDRLLCAFILSSTAAAMDIETHLYFTFWGLNMLKKGALDKASLPATYKQYEEMLKTKMKEMKYPTPYEMLKRMKATGNVKIYACSPTMEMFGVTNETLIPEVDQIAGAAAFLDIAADADITLLI